MDLSKFEDKPIESIADQAMENPAPVGDEKELLTWYKMFRPQGRVISPAERLRTTEVEVDPRTRPIGSAESMGLEHAYPSQKPDAATLDEIRNMKEQQGTFKGIMSLAPWLAGVPAIGAAGLLPATIGTVGSATALEAANRAVMGKETTPHEGVLGRGLAGAGSWIDPRAESEMSEPEAVLRDTLNSLTMMGGPTATLKGVKGLGKVPGAKFVRGMVDELTPQIVNKATGEVVNAVDYGWSKAINYLSTPEQSIFKGESLPQNLMTQIQKGGRAAREFMQPAVERLNPANASEVRKAKAQGAILMAEAERIGSALARPEFTLKDKRDFLRIGRGANMRGVSDRVKSLVKESERNMEELGIDPVILKAFNEKKSKLYTQMLEAPHNVLTSKHTKQLMETIDASVPTDAFFRPGKMRVAIHNAVADPAVSEAEKKLLIELYQLPATTPEIALEAAHHAQSAYLKSSLLKLKDADSMVSAVEKPGYVRDTWGYLGNKGDLFMHRDLALELDSYHKIQNYSKGVFSKYFTSPWKTMKIILSPAAQIRNSFTNWMLNDIGGLPFYRVDIYKEAVHGMAKRDDRWKDFAKLTGGGGTFQHNELVNLAAQWRYVEDFSDLALKGLEKVSKYPKIAYNANEQVFKFAKYLHNLEKGMGKVEAAADAVIPTFNYSEITPAVAFARTHFIPFATWTTKVIPYTFEMAVKHPIRVGKWYAFYEGLQQYALQQTGMSEEEWEDYKLKWPAYMKRGAYLLMPWRDSRDRLNMVDLTYMVPGVGDMKEMINQGLWDTVFQHPSLTIPGDLRSNTKFTGEPIYYDWDSGWMKGYKSFQHIWGSVAPSWFNPWGGDYKKYVNAMQAQPGAMTMKQAIASQLGAKMVPLDDEKIYKLHGAMQRVHLAEMTTQMKKELREAGDDYEAQTKVYDKYAEIRKRFINESLGIEGDEE
jgi:hypothetical protein